MTTRQYTMGLLAVTALLLGAAAAVNRVVDPFWYYRDYEIAGINAVKPKFARFERYIKPRLLVREQPQAIVVGSSLSEVGFDAADPALSANGQLKSYNFAFAGAGWDRVQCYFDYAVAASRLKRVVLEIAPGPLPTIECGGQLAEIADFSELKLLLSLEVLRNSVLTVMEQRQGESSHTRGGRYLYARNVPGVAARFHEYFSGLARSSPGCTLASVPAAPPPTRQFAAASIEPPAGLDLSGLRSVIRAAREQHIELRIFARPLHALSLELDLLCGRLAEDWAALGAVARLIAEEAPQGGIELWEFYNYNERTGEPVIGRDPANWQDPTHFNYEMGSVMLADMFSGGVEGAFGRRLKPDGMVDAYLAFLKGREHYLAQHPRFYEELRSVLAPPH